MCEWGMFDGYIDEEIGLEKEGFVQGGNEPWGFFKINKSIYSLK